MPSRFYPLLVRGSAPARFVSVVSPGTGERVTFETDEDDANVAVARNYLDALRRERPGREPASLLAGALAEKAGQESPHPERTYLDALALSVEMDERFIVIQTSQDGSADPEVRAISAESIDQARDRIRFDMLGAAPVGAERVLAAAGA